MSIEVALPLAADQLPESIRRFCSPDAPERARQMAAKGLVPAKGGELVAVLLQLAADPSATIADAARATLDGVPPAVIEAACDAALHPAFLHALADRLRSNDDLLERLLGNAAIDHETVSNIARTCSERVAERVALDEQRILAAPRILEALYKNKHTRMSTIDRLVDLAVRNGVQVDGIPTFEAHAQAIAGQLIPEPSEEPLPSDLMFTEALAADDDEDAVEQDAAEGKEEVREKFKPLAFQIGEMNFAEKLRMCLIGNAAARALLVRDSNKIVAMSAIASPQVTEAEATGLANSRQVSEEVLRFIGNKREWVGNYEIKKNLLFNPKTPVGISMKFLSHLHVADLRNLSRSRGIPAAIKTAAAQRVAKKGS
ncbi:MAG: hypothetical protein K1X94_25885 [Sandaracinaceae bacterium]|nr:hypothetical protein [Sandaracinaceae bacterium]